MKYRLPLTRPGPVSGQVDERDYAAIGAGCGVSAAFKAPLAATLLIIEEISSHFSKTHATHVVVACIFAFHMARRPATTPPPRPPPPPPSATRQHTSTAHLHRCLQRLYLQA